MINHTFNTTLYRINIFLCSFSFSDLRVYLTAVVFTVVPLQFRKITDEQWPYQLRSIVLLGFVYLSVNVYITAT